LDLNTGTLAPSDWPPDWSAMKEQIRDRLYGGRGPMRPAGGLVFEIPRFGPGPREQDWTIFELNSSYLRDTLLPDMLSRHLGDSDYDVEVIAASDPGMVIYRSISSHGEIGPENADDSVPLLDMAPPNMFGRGRGGRGPRGPGPPQGPGRLRLLARHRAGSLEALVAQTRKRNLALSAA